jgi:hypothetical protein
MKSFIITSIYTSLAFMVFGYLFRILHWEGSRELLWGGFWLHVASYLGYSLLVKDKDDRIVFPLALLVLMIILNNVEIVNQSVMQWTSFIVAIAYLSIHLFFKDYLNKGVFPNPIAVAAGGMLIYMVAALFKILHWPGADVMLMIGLLSLGFICIYLGISKSINPKKKA